MRLSPNFTLRELVRSDTAARLGIPNLPAEAAVLALTALARVLLEPIGEYFGGHVLVSSGYRCPALNATIGGSATGSHPKGEAVDFEVVGVDNLTLARWIALSELPYDQVILEYYVPGDPTSGWVHLSHKREGGNRREVMSAVRQAKGGALYRAGLP